MTRQNLIVTCANADYFPYVQSCIRSLRDRLKPATYQLAFLDTGCDSEQLKWLAAHVDQMAIPSQHFELLEPTPNFLLGLLARPFLRDYFPGFSNYLWVDADAWVQDSSAVELLLAASESSRGLAIVPEVDRANRMQFGGLPKYWQTTFNWYGRHFGEEIASKLYSLPMLNAGVFALHHSAPHWRKWSEAIRRAVQNHCTTMTDQIALNVTVYLLDCFHATELLPAWCNWTCHMGFPRWDVRLERFVETYMPHREIGILHVTTRDKSMIREVATMDGKKMRVHAFFPPHIVPSESVTGES